MGGSLGLVGVVADMRCGVILWLIGSSASGCESLSFKGLSAKDLMSRLAEQRRTAPGVTLEGCSVAQGDSRRLLFRAWCRPQRTKLTLNPCRSEAAFLRGTHGQISADLPRAQAWQVKFNTVEAEPARTACARNGLQGATSARVIRVHGGFLFNRIGDRGHDQQTPGKRISSSQRSGRVPLNATACDMRTALHRLEGA